MLFHLRNILHMFSLSFRPEAEAFVRSKALINGLLVVAFFALASSPGWCATPIGTVIENTAQVTYSAGGVSGININSNTEQLTVEGLIQLNQTPPLFQREPQVFVHGRFAEQQQERVGHHGITRHVLRRGM